MLSGFVLFGLKELFKRSIIEPMKRILLIVSLFFNAYSVSDNRLQRIFTNLHNADFWSQKDAYYKNEHHVFEQPETRAQLKKLVRDFSISVVFDFGCGDCTWLEHDPLLGIKRYVGFDIVQGMINYNVSRDLQKSYYFVCCDLTQQRLPQADLVICRDLFVHLQFIHILEIMRNIKQSKSKFVLMTTYPDVLEQVDLEVITGRTRQLNMQKSPFNFPPPMRLIKEQSKHQKYLGLWSVQDIKL